MIWYSYRRPEPIIRLLIGPRGDRHVRIDIMNKWTFIACGLGAAFVLTACSSSDEQSAKNSSTSASLQKATQTVARPPATADDNTWGTYLADQGRVHAEDIGMKPFIYVIPSADSQMGDDRRKNETESIVNGAGKVIIPGALLILGGPDANVTRGFVEGLGKEVKPDTLKGVTVLVVGDASQKDLLAKTLAPAGARVRVVSM